MAVAFEHYGQTVATAAPQPARTPQPQPVPAYVPPQAQTQTTARAGDGLIGTFVLMAVYAGLLVAIGQLLTLTPLGNVMFDDPSGLGLGVVIGGLLVALLVTGLVLMLVTRVTR